MTTYLPTIKQLQYLVALHEHGHFGRAAESCAISQPALSVQIRELEAELSELTSSFLTAEAFSVEDNHRPA